MGMLDRLALATAERLRASFGTEPALAALMRVLISMEAGPTKARVIVQALGYATTLGDELRIDALCAMWAEQGTSAPRAELYALCRELSAGRNHRHAERIADAEVERSGRARAFYLRARCRELLGEEEGALADLAEAASLAQREEEEAIERAARARRSRILLRAGSQPHGRSAQAKEALDGGEPRGDVGEDPRLLLMRAEIGLAAPGRYVRARALDLIGRAWEEAKRRRGRTLLRGGDRQASQAAFRLAARHADRLGAALSAIEADRIAALFAKHPDPAVAEQAQARLSALAEVGEAGEDEGGWVRARAAHADPVALAHLMRAKAVLAGGSAGPRPSAGQQSGPLSTSRSRLAWVALAGLVALDRRQGIEARAYLDECARLLEEAEARPSPPLWTFAIAAALDREAGIRGRAHALVERLLSLPGAPPPRGFSALGAALARGGQEHLARAAFRRGAELREKGSRDALARSVLRAGWEAASQGERNEALRLLREAKEILACK